jgi:hypothetical protein
MVVSARSGGRSVGHVRHARMASIEKMVHDSKLKFLPEDASKAEKENGSEVEDRDRRKSTPTEKKTAPSEARGALEARDANSRMGSKIGEHKDKTKKVRR